jgi:hypothetical protein
MAIATAMYHSGKNTLRKVSREAEDIAIPKSVKQRRLHKALLRYHDPKNWPLIREALKDMGRNDLIGNGKHHLIPSFQPKGTLDSANKIYPFKTKHTGLERSHSEMTKRSSTIHNKSKKSPKSTIKK